MASIGSELITNRVEFTEIPSSGDESEHLLPTEQTAKDFRGLCCYRYRRGKEISYGLHLSTPRLSKAGEVQIPEGCMSVSMPPAPPFHHPPADMKFTVSLILLLCSVPYAWKPVTVRGERV